MNGAYTQPLGDITYQLDPKTGFRGGEESQTVGGLEAEIERAWPEDSGVSKTYASIYYRRLNAMLKSAD
jgi:hypothetical protein